MGFFKINFGLPVAYVNTGTVVGLSGLEGHVLKSATLSSTPECPRFCGLYEQARPIVRVALATERITDIPALHRGMQLLNKVRRLLKLFNISIN